MNNKNHTPKNLSWKEAIFEILEKEPDTMHYVEISKKIAHKRLVGCLGPIPNQTVYNTLKQSIRDNEGVFERTRKGYYKIKW